MFFVLLLIFFPLCNSQIGNVLSGTLNLNNYFLKTESFLSISVLTSTPKQLSQNGFSCNNPISANCSSGPLEMWSCSINISSWIDVVPLNITMGYLAAQTSWCYWEILNCISPYI